MKAKLLEAALCYAEKGLNVIPLRQGDKKPFLPEWQKKGTTEKKQIEEWWSSNPGYNIGFTTGQKYNLLVIDLDSMEALDFLKVWLADRGLHFPEKLWVVKSIRGYHLYFALDRPQKNSEGLFFDGSGIDVRGEGGCICAPPSIRDGGQYEWIRGPEDFPLALANENVFQFIREGIEAAKKSQAAPKGEEAGGDSNSFELPAEIFEGKRNRTLFEYACSLQGKGVPDESIFPAVVAVNMRRCKPSLPEREVRETVKSALKYDKGGSKAKAAKPDKGLIDKLIELDAANRFSWSDKGLGEMFAAVFGDVIGFNPVKKNYMFFDGCRWRPDLEGMMARRYAKKLADALQAYAASYTNLEDERKTAFMRHAMKLMANHTREVMIRDARDSHIIEEEKLDTNDYLLNCLNCTLDLSGPEPIRKEHDAYDLISMVCGAEYDPAATCPKWEQTLREIMQEDEEKIVYLQKIFGLTLTGCTREEECYFLFGSTSRNGKSTVAETIMDILGDYATKISPETLAAKSKDSRTASPDLAKLKGARMVLASEPPKKMIFDAALVKTLTGRDRITARYLYENEFSFLPVFKLFLNTNYLPMIMDETVFRSDRIRVISFDRHFEPKEQDKHLREKILQDERPGILNWMLEGWRKYQEDDQKNEFKPPEAVKKATEKYEQESDKIGTFFADCLEEMEGNNLAAKEVYEVYQKWCNETGQRPEGRKNFYIELRSRGKLIDSGTVGRVTVRNVVPGYAFSDDYEVPFE